MPSSKNNSIRLRIVFAVGALALALSVWLQHRQPEPGRVPQPVSTALPSNSAAVKSPAQTSVVPPTADDNALRAACASLRMDPNGRNNRLKLAALRKQLAAMPKDQAVAAIRQFLNSKEDASTHLGFKLVSNGTLDDAPTLRTFLLDELGRLDPAAAAAYSSVILAGMDSPDEWAVALRNLAAGDASADGRALLEQKMSQMLTYAPWQQNPSTGYLEAFDVPVFLGGTDFVPTLSSLVQCQDNPAIAHAAFLSLDRLVINNPTAVLTALEADPSLMTGRESTRADYFARADVTDPQQRQILENYLLDPDITASELRTFAGVFPNANFMISPNLLTPTTTLDHDTLINRDSQSLALAQQWMADPRFAQVVPQLQIVVQRLEGFAAQVKQGQ